jgi:uncharacterized protein YcfL
MKKRVMLLLTLAIVGCSSRTPAQTAAEKQQQIDTMQHDLLCMRAKAGEVSAMAEIALRQTNCLK